MQNSELDNYVKLKEYRDNNRKIYTVDLGTSSNAQTKIENVAIGYGAVATFARSGNIVTVNSWTKFTTEPTTGWKALQETLPIYFRPFQTVYIDLRVSVDPSTTLTWKFDPDGTMMLVKRTGSSTNGNTFNVAASWVCTNNSSSFINSGSQTKSFAAPSNVAIQTYTSAYSTTTLTMPASGFFTGKCFVNQAGKSSEVIVNGQRVQGIPFLESGHTQIRFMTPVAQGDSVELRTSGGGFEELKLLRTRWIDGDYYESQQSSEWFVSGTINPLIGIDNNTSYYMLNGKFGILQLRFRPRNMAAETSINFFNLGFRLKQNVAVHVPVLHSTNVIVVNVKTDGTVECYMYGSGTYSNWFRAEIPFVLE